jgi:neutral ceramidase
MSEGEERRNWSMSPARPAIALIAVVIVTALALTAGAEEPLLRAGTARVDITPAKPVLLGGYASRREPSKGVHDPLSARVVAFERAGRRLVLVSLDNLGFYNQTSEPLRRAVLEANRLEPAELFLAAIHTHSAPILTLDEAKGSPANVEYTRALGEKLAAGVRAALGSLAPVRVGIGTGASPVGANRRETVRGEDGKTKVVLGRNPHAPIDREVQVLKVNRASDGAPAAVVFDFSTHATSLGPANLLVSGDVLGLAEQFVEKQVGGGAAAPAFAGASGNIDPWFRVLPKFEDADGWIPEPVLLATLLGEEVVRVARTVEAKEAGGEIRSVLRTIDVPGKPAAEAKTVAGGQAVPLTITAARVGEVAFVGFGCEVFNEIGREIKSSSPWKTTFVITHCNGAAGYLPNRQAYAEGGYEVESSPFAPGAAEVVVEEARRLLQTLRAPIPDSARAQ